MTASALVLSLCLIKAIAAFGSHDCRNVSVTSRLIWTLFLAVMTANLCLGVYIQRTLTENSLRVYVGFIEDLVAKFLSTEIVDKDVGDGLISKQE